ncbi:hypothetical protein GOFOIKOB_3979 [Methylobacterium tardum]|uniref:Uncharacterized protein n=1 Tax=Methylobacterium tardum TaxID=374432 RepID=A0AA37WR32_9HYPH|nr:hypothetical protein GOFOIKOB_3979 [Methylobacterium tardum]GLS69926.1 hypothetical protein GCM10007890_19390 [Methylobacterium tardum]
MDVTSTALCLVCQGRTWIDIRPGQTPMFRQRWPLARFLPGLNDCPACVQTACTPELPQASATIPPHSDHYSETLA